MAQEINEVGTLLVSAEKNVIFKKRNIKNIFLAENETCTIDFVKSSDEGDKLETISMPFLMFHEKVETSLWELVDKAIESEE